jgi:hypothetical protein
VQVHPEYGRAAIGISDKLSSQHNDSPLAFWQLTCPPSCLLRTVALTVLSGKAASLGVERVLSYARAVLTDNRRSMLMQRMMQLPQVKMNGMLLEWEALSCCAKSTSAMIDNQASFESIFDDLQHFEEEEKQDVQSSKALVICLAMQKDRWPLRLMLRLPCPLLTCFRFEDGAQLTHTSPFCLSFLGVAKGHLAAQNAIEQA